MTDAFLLKTVWGGSYVGKTQYLRKSIAQLREIVEVDSDYPRLIVSEPRIGYRFKIFDL